MNAPVTLGPYVLERELGAGAMGVVYLAHHPQLGARYALKVLKPDLCEPRDVERFERELQSMAAISAHPNVVRIHTSGVEAGRLYYVMDLVDGEDLQRTVSRGPVDPRQAARIVRDVSGAVDALHSAGYIHRDIKPENILMDRSGVPLLTDFGLARMFADQKNRLTMTGELVGTPAFMAPEQALGNTDLGPGTDVYALGVVLYLLLSGKPPIQGRSKLEVLSKVALGELIPLSSSAPDVPQQLAAICAHCMRLDPTRRPSAAEVARALDDYLAERAAPGESQTAGEVAQQRKLTLLLVALCVTALVLGVSAVMVSIQRRDARTTDSVLETAERLESDAEQALSHDQGSAELVTELPAAREQLRGILGEDPAEALVERLLRLLCYEGELALRQGKVEQARGRLTDLVALPDQVKLTHRQKQEWRVRAEALESAIAIHEGKPLSPKLANALTKALERWPKRVDLARLQIRQDLQSGQVDAAQERMKLLLARQIEVPVDLRCEVLLAAKDLRGASDLMGEIRDPTLRAHLALRVAQHLIDRSTAKEVSEELGEDLRSPELAEARQLCRSAASVLGADDPDRLAAIALLRARLDALSKLAFRRGQDRSTVAKSKRKVAQVLRVGELILALRELEPGAALDPDRMQDFKDYASIMVWALELPDFELLLSVDDTNIQLLAGYVLQVNDKYLHNGLPLPVAPEQAERIFLENLELARGPHPEGMPFALEQLGRFYGYLQRGDDLIRLLADTKNDAAVKAKNRIKLARRAAGVLRERKAADSRRILAPMVAEYPENTDLLFDHLHIGLQLYGETGRQDAELRKDLLAGSWRFLDLVSPGHPSWRQARVLVSSLLVPLELAEGRRDKAREAIERMLALAESAPANRRPGLPELVATRLRMLIEDGAPAEALDQVERVITHLERETIYLGWLIDSGTAHSTLLGIAKLRLIQVKKLLEQTETLRTLARNRDTKGLLPLLASVESLQH